jgi:general secretion pathway protein J
MNNKTNGFTLIEVLIAMTLLSMMVVLLFASLKIGADSWYKGETKIAEVNEVAVVYNFFQQHLALAKPLLNDLSKSEPAPLAFQGKKQSVQFVSGFPASVGRLGLQLFTVKLDKKVIKVTTKPFFALQDNRAENTEEVVLLSGVSDFNIAYFGSDEEAGNSRWHDEWLEKSTQPTLIKISIKRDHGSFHPDMFIALKITGQYANVNSLVITQ